MSSSIINGVTSSNVLKRVLVDSAGHLQVDVLSGGGATEFLNDATYNSASTKGSVAMGLHADSSDLQFIAVDADGHLQVDVLSSAAIAVTNGDLSTIAGAINSGNMQVDISASSASVAVTHTGLTDLAAAIGTDGSDSVTSTIAVGGTDGANLQALSVSTAGVLNTKLSDVTSGTFTLTDGITANTGAGGVTLPVDDSPGLDIRGKSGKLTIFGSISDFTNSGGDGYNNIQLFGSLNSASSNSTFTDLGSTFEIPVDSDGKFGQTIDITMPYLKFNTVNDQGGTRTLLLKYAFN